MCGSKKAVDAVAPTSPSPNSSHRHRRTIQQPSSSSIEPSTTASTTNGVGGGRVTSSSSSSFSSRNSLSSLRSSLPDNPHLYDISEIRKATNNFLAKNNSSSSSTRSWRCTLQGKEVMIFQRKLGRQLSTSNVRQKLSSISKSNHIALVNLLGASISGDYIYLVYDFIHGASLANLLHNHNNPDFTVLNTWISRMQIATDLANGLDYIHNNTGLAVNLVHNHIKSSSVIVTEPNFNAKLAHYGTADICGEPVEERETIINEIVDKFGEEDLEKQPSNLKSLAIRSNSIKFNGTRGYLSPEFQLTGVGTRKSDVYAFGIVLLELLSGEEPVKYRYEKETKEYVKVDAVEGARAAAEDGGEREGRMRKWVDRRLRDSFPVEVAEKITRLALDCVHVDPNQRPDMRRVAGKISKLYLDSRVWCDRMNIPTDITVSFGPR